ncbi:GntR family transcriptional regulator [Streptomyces sp. CA-100214]
MPGQVHKHHRIVRVLSDEIRAGVHSDGSRLPGEHALTQRFGVSRTTLRQALQALGEEGLIATHAGIGSFVTFEGHRSTTGSAGPRPSPSRARNSRPRPCASRRSTTRSWPPNSQWTPVRSSRWTG